ncbi:uncharacterized protein [Haliotis cracherodii]|uniref:uncharacterized protein isoform X1 n=1 Tax=Haliotis cracherodii TaxID=6455 RepID=UPI0039E78AD9
MFGQSRKNRWPNLDDRHSDGDRDFQDYTRYPDTRLEEPFSDHLARMSLPGQRYSYQPFSQNNSQPYSQPFSQSFPEERDVITQPYLGNMEIPPNGRNVRTYTLPHRRGTRERQPIMIVPPKREPKLITMEVKAPDPEPIFIMPPPPPKKKVIEYEVPVRPKTPEPILVPVMPPPKDPEYVTVRHVVEEQADGTNWVIPNHHEPPAYRTSGPTISRIPDDYERKSTYSDTLLGVRRTILWELVIASFVLFVIMLLIAIFVAGFLS